MQIEEGPLEAKAQHRIKEWSQRIIELSTERYVSSTDQLSDALTMLRAIPAETPLYSSSQSLAAQWQQEWADNDYYVQLSLAALGQGNLTVATQSAENISRHPAWSAERSQILMEIQKDEQALNELADQAKQYLDEGKLQLSVEVALQLPDDMPWRRTKLEILEQVRIIETQSDDERAIVFVAFAVLLFCTVFISLSARR